MIKKYNKKTMTKGETQIHIARLQGWMEDNKPPKSRKGHDFLTWARRVEEYNEAKKELQRLREILQKFIRTSGQFKDESAFQKVLAAACSAAGHKAEREVMAGDSQRRCDVVVEAHGITYAVECKLSGAHGSLDAAIGQVLCMSRLTGFRPILAIPSDTQIDPISHAVATDLGIPVVNENTIVALFAGTPVPR